MNYDISKLAIAVFVAFVGFVLWISYYFARKTKSAKDYYAAGGNIHWAVNGIAFAGDYLSAASFLGICGMIATMGYDGFLYSIGYLAGWIVALFVVAEPLKRMGKFTFADALDSKFNSRGIQLVAAISTLVVSVFYLIPQMVGAGVLVTPLLGLPHYAGVIIVGTVVIIIVATAGMASTTYVQFLKGSLLIIFSMVLVFSLFTRGIRTTPLKADGSPMRAGITLPYSQDKAGQLKVAGGWKAPKDWQKTPWGAKGFVKLEKGGESSLWKLDSAKGLLLETQTVAQLPDGSKLYNGAPRSEGKFYAVGHVNALSFTGKAVESTGTLDPVSFLTAIRDSEVTRWLSVKVKDGDTQVTAYYPQVTPGKDLLKPGMLFKVDREKGAKGKDLLNFVSLMLALFLGTASLPHILIRYYTVPSPAAARKSTIVAIAAIGLFYLLTLYMGLGAMVSGVLDPVDGNMAAPLLAKSFGVLLFAVICAIAFATVLGTVSGLIVAASGAVAHDFMDSFLNMKLSEGKKVLAGKLAAVGVGIIAMALGILYEGMNVSYLVGWAFAVAASANLPAIVMILFWKGTTAKGVAASVLVGMLSAVGMILLSPEMYVKLYGLDPAKAPMLIDSPTIFSVPLSFATLVVVSLLTKAKSRA